MLRATTACHFSPLIWSAGSAPAALASLLFDPPEPQIIGKTQCFAIYLFARLEFLSSGTFSSVIFFLLLFSDSSHLCFSSVHIVGSLASKLPSSTIQLQQLQQLLQLLQLRYAALHYTTLRYTTLHSTTPRYTTPHYTRLGDTTARNSTTHYTTLHCTTLITPHHNYNCNCTTLITLCYNYDSTTLQLQLQLHYTTLHPAAVSEVTAAAIAATRKKHNSTTFRSIQWIRSAIRDSQQPTSPIGFLFLELPPPPCAVLLVLQAWVLVCYFTSAQCEGNGLASEILHGVKTEYKNHW